MPDLEMHFPHDDPETWRKLIMGDCKPDMSERIKAEAANEFYDKYVDSKSPEIHDEDYPDFPWKTAFFVCRAKRGLSSSAFHLFVANYFETTIELMNEYYRP